MEEAAMKHNPKRKRMSKKERPSISLVERIQPDAAGIDCGQSSHFVAVPPDRDPQPVREFRTFTTELERLADWLARCGIKTVAMESTGVYWIPLYEILEQRGFEVLLTRARVHSVLRLGISAPQQATAMMRLFPRATDPAAPINAGARRDAAQGIAEGRIVADSKDVVVAYIMGGFMAGVNRALDLPSERVPEFAHGFGAILLQGLGLKRAEAKRIIHDGVRSIL
jgi:hypothetical protein